VLANLAA